MKAMKLRDVEAALLAASCRLLRSKGGHDVWVCPCGKHRTAVPRHRVIAPGTIRAIIRHLACLPEGWLQ